jgi:LacI family transcriptional regulator
MATIKDVADDCGFSIATVSAVINGAAWVPDATRKRVLKSVEAVRYVPNTLARGLKTRRSRAVGVIVSDLTNPFFTEIVRALEHTLRERDHNVFLCDSDHEFSIGGRNFMGLAERQVDGMVLIGASVPDSIVEQFTEAHEDVPIIAIERDYPAGTVTRLLVDSEHGGFLATTHLLRQGYRRIAFIAGPESGPGGTSYGRIQRRRGYERALAEAGLSIRESYIVRGNFRFEGGQEAMIRLLDLPDPPDAVFASNDLMALGAIRVARDRGISVPGQLGVVGYDDIPAASVITPSLTTLAMPKTELGRAAGELVLDQMRRAGRHAHSRQMFGAQLIVRESSAGPGPRGSV